MLGAAMRCKVVDAPIQCRQTGVVRLGDFHFEFLMKPDDEVHEVHGIDIELIADSQVGLELRQVGLPSNLTEGTKNHLSDLVLGHSFSGSCRRRSMVARKSPPRWPSL